MISISQAYNVSFKPFIFAHAFSITIGSVMSPIRNPQNLIIAIYLNMSNPFFLFLNIYLFLIFSFYSGF